MMRDLVVHKGDGEDFFSKPLTAWEWLVATAAPATTICFRACL